MRKKAKKKVTPAKKEKEILVSIEQKKKILGLLLITMAILIFFSIASFNESDHISQLFDDIIKHPDHTSNWIGIIGAHIANVFVNGTLGYFSIIFPVIMFFWGLSFLVVFNYRKIFINFNFILIAAIIFSSFFGLIDNSNGAQYFKYSGRVGLFLGTATKSLLGATGGMIFFVFAFMALLVLALDLKIERIFSSAKTLYVDGRAKLSKKNDEEKIEKTIDNLKKIKKLKDEKPEEKKEFLTAEDLMKTESDDQTLIRIKHNFEEKQLDEDKKDKKLSGRKKKNGSQIEVNPDDFSGIENPLVNANNENPDDENLPQKTSDIESNLPNPWEEQIEFEPLSLDLLEKPEEEDFKFTEEELTKHAQLLTEKLKLFDIDITKIDVTPGPVVALYEIVPAPGVKISKIVNLEDDIALALSARGIRIIAPIPGKGAIGVEIPNVTPSIVKARSVMAKVRETNFELPIALGKQINGEVYLADLAKMPHLLIAGSTGSGKSVGINMIISSLLYSKHPSEVKFMMIDPKKIELSFYKKLRRHYLAICPDLNEEIVTIPQNAVILLKSVEIEMEKRYDKLAKAGVRNIVEYNKKVSDPQKKPRDTETMKHYKLPYLVVIIDELADLMITAGKEVEEPITRLAQLARAVGIHLVVATQRPSVNVITGVIKANFSARIAYQVASKIDSRTILDMNGAEQLLGRGDMLFLPTGSPKPTRIQNAFISTDEVERITDVISSRPGFSKPYYLPSLYEKKRDMSTGFIADLDPMFEEAARVLVRNQKGSVSLLQRRLKLGYSRAARIVDQLEEAGIVGPNNGSSARDVIIEDEEQLETILRSL